MPLNARNHSPMATGRRPGWLVALLLLSDLLLAHPSAAAAPTPAEARQRLWRGNYEEARELYRALGAEQNSLRVRAIEPRLGYRGSLMHPGRVSGASQGFFCPAYKSMRRLRALAMPPSVGII